MPVTIQTTIQLLHPPHTLTGKSYSYTNCNWYRGTVHELPKCVRDVKRERENIICFIQRVLFKRNTLNLKWVQKEAPVPVPMYQLEFMYVPSPWRGGGNTLMPPSRGVNTCVKLTPYGRLRDFSLSVFLEICIK